MPTHDYECPKCVKTVERFVPLAKFEEPQKCDTCGGVLERQFPRVGATHGDEAPWLRSTTEFLKDGDPAIVHNSPVSSRKEYNKLLREKGLEPAG